MPVSLLIIVSCIAQTLCKSPVFGPGTLAEFETVAEKTTLIGKISSTYESELLFYTKITNVNFNVTHACIWYRSIICTLNYIYFRGT